MLPWLRRRLDPSPSPSRKAERLPRRSRYCRPTVEALEDRAMMTLPHVYFGGVGWVSEGNMHEVIVAREESEDVVAVDFTITEITATEGDDYYIDGAPGVYSGTITFSPYDLTASIPVFSLDDWIFEDDERWSIELSNPVNAQLGDPALNQSIFEIAHISDNDPYVVISQDNVGVEPLTSEESRFATFTIEMLGIEGGPGYTDVTYETFVGPGDSATAGEDFESTGGTVTQGNRILSSCGEDS